MGLALHGPAAGDWREPYQQQQLCHKVKLNPDTLMSR